MSADRPLRLFVAAYPPPPIAEQLLAQLAALNLRGVKLSPPPQVHLTLQFIGDTDPRELDDVQESVARSVSGLEPFSVAVPRLISLPERARARLIAAELEPHPTLLELHRRLALRLANNPKQNDRFLPHMTLGRCTGLGERLDIPTPGQPHFEITEVMLIRSILHSKGAEHRPIAAFPLDP